MAGGAVALGWGQAYASAFIGMPKGMRKSDGLGPSWRPNCCASTTLMTSRSWAAGCCASGGLRVPQLANIVNEELGGYSEQDQALDELMGVDIEPLRDGAPNAYLSLTVLKSEILDDC